MRKMLSAKAGVPFPVVIGNALTDNKLPYASCLPEMAGRLFILLIVKVIRYTLLIDFKCVVECDSLVGGYASCYNVILWLRSVTITLA